jgi:hypothetical protein
MPQEATMSKSKKLRHRGPIVPESAAKTFIQVTPDLFRPVEVEPRKTPEMLTIRCQVEGISPLLLDAMPPEMVESALIRKQKAQIDTSEDLDVRAARSLYRELWDEDGALGIPQENLFACLVATSRSPVRRRSPPRKRRGFRPCSPSRRLTCASRWAPACP